MFSRGSSSTSTPISPIVHSSETHYTNDHRNWTIPEQKIESIYKVGTLDFKTAFSVRNHEETISIEQEQQSLQLLSSLSLRKYLDRGFRYIHFGLVQVAIKPL